MYTIFTEIKDILNTEVKSQRGIKAVYYGDPGIINKSNLPAITIYPGNTTLEARGCGAGGTDRVRHTVNIGLIWDLRDEFDKKPEEVKITKSLLKTIFERDASGNMQADTIIGAIRKYVTLNSTVMFNNNFNIDYGITNRRSFPTLESVIKFQIELRPQRPV